MEQGQCRAELRGGMGVGGVRSQGPSGLSTPYSCVLTCPKLCEPLPFLFLFLLFILP